VEYITYMEWKVVAHPEFAAWLIEQNPDLRLEIAANLLYLQQTGPALGRPRVDTVKGSSFDNMKELRIQFAGDPYRIIFAFDPIRQAVLLLGGNKTGEERWYKANIRIADKRYNEHLITLRKGEKTP